MLLVMVIVVDMVDTMDMVVMLGRLVVSTRPSCASSGVRGRFVSMVLSVCMPMGLES